MIYGYVRVSTDKQSTENQRFEIENYSKAKGFRIERWVDETISGTTSASDRQLGRLLKQIRKGDTLVTTELSRLGRNLMQVMSFLHQCMERDIIVLTVKERYELGNNINSKILAFAFSLSAEIERNLISQRTMQVRLSGKENVIKKMINEKCSMNEIAEKFGVNRQTLRDFLRNTFPDWRKYRYIK